MGEEFEVRGNGAFDADTIYDLLKGWWFLFFYFAFFPSRLPLPFVKESKLLRVYANVDTRDLIQLDEIFIFIFYV